MNQQGAHSLVPTRINDFQRCWRRVCERAAPEVTLAPNGKLMAKHCLRQCSSRYQHALIKLLGNSPGIIAFFVTRSQAGFGPLILAKRLSFWKRLEAF